MTGISFCMTCHNRLGQIQQTLANNLETLAPGMEIVLVDFLSNDGLSEWVWNQFQWAIEQKKLIFFEVKSDASWHASKAKNLAHRLASKKYVFNLDADNFVHRNDLEQISMAASQDLSCHQWSGDWLDGTYGRIGLPKKLYLELGGYDEGFLPMGGQDVDLLRRIMACGQNVVQLAAPHELPEKNAATDKIAAVTQRQGDPDQVFEILNKTNIHLSNLKIEHLGVVRRGGFATFSGLYNGQTILLDGFNNVHRIKSAGNEHQSQNKEPILFDGDDALFKKTLKQVRVYLEYGCGQSTLWADKYGDCQIFSIDTSQHWIEKVKSQASNKVNLYWIDCGPLGDWGRPLGLSKSQNFIQYAKALWNKDIHPELVLIDGRFRVLCFLQTLKEPLNNLINI